VPAQIDTKVNLDHLEATLQAEGIKKFADPMNVLLAVTTEKRGV
jgi:hypothetical protein